MLCQISSSGVPIIAISEVIMSKTLFANSFLVMVFFLLLWLWDRQNAGPLVCYAESIGAIEYRPSGKIVSVPLYSEYCLLIRQVLVSCPSVIVTVDAVRLVIV